MGCYSPLAVVLGLLAVAAGSTPRWAATYDMQRSTIVMPCNNSGFMDTAATQNWGVVDFDWSNAKGTWANQRPMDCEERLVAQARLVKSHNPQAKVWVYRNLVKALPWYSTVRTALADPAKAGFFLKFKPGGTPHVPECTNSSSNPPGKAKCSQFYHDQQETPLARGGGAVLDNATGWTIYQGYNGVSGCSNVSCTMWFAPGSPWLYPSWKECAAAAALAKKTNPEISLFTWWRFPWPGPDPQGRLGGTCWFAKDLVGNHYGPEDGHVTGFASAGRPPGMYSDAGYQLCNSDCDCGEVPCGEYIWDHRNGTMLRDFLVNEFILNSETGLGNPLIDGFYFDDGWRDSPAPIPPWAPASYHECDMSPIGGASEMDFNCAFDSGLTQEDTTLMTKEWSLTTQAALAAVVAHGGFAWPLLTQRSASLDLADPRPPATCNACVHFFEVMPQSSSLVGFRIIWAVYIVLLTCVALRSCSDTCEACAIRVNQQRT